MSTATALPQQPNNPIARALAMAGLLIVAISVIIGAVLFSSYRETIEREETNLHNLADAFAAQSRYAMRALDLLIENNERFFLQEASRNPESAGTEFLNYRSASEEMLLGMFVFSPDGHLLGRRVIGPSVQVPAEPPMASAGEQLRIGISNIDRTTGRATISISRNMLDSYGHFAGTILAQADSQYFQRIFNSADLGSGGSVTLLHRDGTMLVRGPTLPGSIGRSFARTPLFQRYLPAAPDGAFEATSPVDGVSRLYGYRAVDGYPLVIITGRDKADTLTVWYRWLWSAIAFWTFLSFTLLFLAWRTGRESSRQAALIAQLAASEARLTHSFGYLKTILDALAAPLWVLDAQRRIVLFNQSFRQFIGRGDELAGLAEAEVLDGAGHKEREELYQQVLGDGPRSVETEMRNGAGELRTVIQLSARVHSDDNATQVVNSLTDITERKRVELRLAFLAEFDQLTELPNQARLRRVLKEAIRSPAGNGAHVAVMVVALERLQEVADLLGQDAADEVIRSVAAQLRGLAPPCLCVARVKANEFALVLPAAAAEGGIDRFALELHRLLSEPARVRGREFYLAPVVGISLYPQDAASVNELMRLADIAKHRARSDVGEPVHFYSESTHIILNERLTIEEHLRHALERNELSLAYQPKVDLADGRIAGLEVLLRWTNDALGPVSPARFVPIAEHTGLIVPIGAWVLRTACEQASRWRRELHIEAKVAVNLSIRQFYQKEVLQSIRDALRDSALEPSALELEITESIAMSRVDAVERLLRDIRALGVELSIDDFGTGYSSLAYLKRFPVQRLKIDRAFVHDLGRGPDSAAIVRSVVALGHGLQMRIVAEGVETDEQLALLRELGCDEYQGYLFSHPVPADAVPDLLRRHGRPAGGG